MTRIRRAGLAPSAYTEKEWQRQVEQIADRYWWDYRYHVTRPKMSPWGWPDLVLIRRKDRRIVFAELKAQSTAVTPDQLGLLELLLDVAGGGWTNGRAISPPVMVDPLGLARIDVELWRPGDIDRVIEVLR